MSQRNTTEGTRYSYTRELEAHRDRLIEQIAQMGRPSMHTSAEDLGRLGRLEADLIETRTRLAKRSRAAARAKATP